VSLVEAKAAEIEAQMSDAGHAGGHAGGTRAA